MADQKKRDHTPKCWELNDHGGGLYYVCQCDPYEMSEKQFDKWVKTASADEIKAVLIKEIKSGRKVSGVCSSDAH